MACLHVALFSLSIKTKIKYSVKDWVGPSLITVEMVAAKLMRQHTNLN